MKMKKEEMNPYVRFFKKIARAQVYNKPLCAHDYRLFYLIKGRITFEIEEDSRLLEGGDAIVIPPAKPYRLLFEEEGEVSYYLINFDFVFDGEYRPSRTPVEQSVFDEKRIFSKAYSEPFGEIFVQKDCRVIERTLDEMYQCNITEGKDLAVLGSALMKCVLMRLILKGGEAGGVVGRVKEYIEKNSDKKLTNVAVAEQFGYHPYYLGNLFLQAEGKSLHGYINEMRVKAIKDRLCLTEKPLGLIAEEMGFTDGSYFSCYFRKATGMTPKEYRELCK